MARGRSRSRWTGCCCSTSGPGTCGASIVARPLRRDDLATSPPSVADALPWVVEQPGRWQDQLLPLLDGLGPEVAAESAVAIVDGLAEDTMHEAGGGARRDP